MLMVESHGGYQTSWENVTSSRWRQPLVAENPPEFRPRETERTAGGSVF